MNGRYPQLKVSTLADELENLSFNKPWLTIVTSSCESVWEGGREG